MGGNVEQKALMDYLLIDWREKDRLIGVNVLREAAGVLSDHHLVVAKVKVWCGFVERRPKGGGKEIVRISECNRGLQEEI